MTAVVIENPELKNCTKAIFRGLPKSLGKYTIPLYVLLKCVFVNSTFAVQLDVALRIKSPLFGVLGG